MKRDLTLFLEDILEAIDLISESTKHLTKEDFEEDKDKVDATIRRVEVIGEAVKNLPSSFRGKYPKVPWRDIAGMRDVLTHAYFGIEIDKVWNVIKKEIPKLKKQIREILEKEK